MSANWKTQQWLQDLKRPVFIPIPNWNEMPNNVQTPVQLCSFHMLEGNAQNLQARLQQIINQELPGVFLDKSMDFKEAEELEIKLPTFTGLWRKQGSSSKASTSASLTTLKSLTLWITTNCGKFINRWENQVTLPASWETHIPVKKQQVELHMEQWASSKLGKEDKKAIYYHLVYLTYIRVHHVKCQAGWNTSWNQDYRRNINNLRYADDTTLMAEREKN